MKFDELSDLYTEYREIKDILFRDEIGDDPPDLCVKERSVDPVDHRSSWHSVNPKWVPSDEVHELIIKKARQRGKEIEAILKEKGIDFDPIT